MKRLNKLNRKFYLLAIKGKKVVARVSTKKLNRFSISLQRGEILQPGVSAYIRVTDQPKKNNRGNIVRFYNDGIYTDRKKLMLAYHAFIE